MKRTVLISGFMLVAVYGWSYNSEEGKSIFTTRCTSCHSIEKNVVGPALMNVHERRDEEWIISFVHSSQSLVRSGDTAAVNLYNAFNKVPMPDHTDLTDEQVKSILAYIKTESNALAAKPKSTIQRPDELKANYTPLKPEDHTAWFAIGTAIALLTGTLLLRVKVESMK